MAIEDESRKFEQGADSGLTQGPRLRSPGTSLGTRLGSTARAAAPRALATAGAVINSPIRNTEAALNVATSVPRAIGGQVRDAGAAFQGEQSPGPVGPIQLPRLAMPRLSAPSAPAQVPAAAPAGARTLPYQRTSPASRYVSQRPGALSAAAEIAPPMTAAAPGGIELQPGDVNTFTGTNGVTRPVPGLLRRPGGSEAAAVPAAAPVTAQAPDLGTPRGRQGAIIRNPGDNVESRLTRALGSASVRGSPSTRAALAKAILDEEGGIRDERQSALATGDQIDVATTQNNARAQEAHLFRQQRADEFNVGTQEERADRAARTADNAAERAARPPAITTTDDGGMGIVGPNGTFTPITDGTGARLRAPMAPRQTGDLTQGDLLKSYTDRYNAISGSLAPDDQKKAQIDALNADPLYSQLPGRGGAQAAPPAEAVAQLRANPGARDQFDQVFGAGAASRYLTN